MPKGASGRPACAQSQRNDVSEGTDRQKGFAPEPVDQPQPDKCEHQVRDTDADGLEQGGFFCQTGEFKDAGRKVENGVNA